MDLLTDLWQRRAELTPTRRAVWQAGRWFTYAELNARACRVAARLSGFGIIRGDRVAILAYNDIAHLDLIAAARKTGAVHTPFNFRWSAAEVAAAAVYVRPKLFVVGPEFAAPPGAPAITLETLEQWASAGSAPDLNAPSLTMEDPFMLLFTGGTS